MKLEKVFTIGSKELDDLGCGLVSVVKLGASIGFLDNIDINIAKSYWENVNTRLNEGLDLFIARHNEKIVGSIQLDRCMKDNGRHRAEVQKLFVIPEYRKQGIAKQLLNQVEIAAFSKGIKLLVLDTETDSPAEKLYLDMQWTKVGEIPSYALSTTGVLKSTSYLYKLL